MKTFTINNLLYWNYQDPPPDSFMKPGTKLNMVIRGEEDIEVRDEYHSMHELYEHRMALNIALFNMWYDLDVRLRGDYQAGMESHKIMKSKLHADGTMFDGYFIVMAITQHGQISYHYKLKHWDKFRIPEVERTPQWDGHSSLEVMDRLMRL